MRTRELILAGGRRDRGLLGEAVLTIPQLGESLTCPVVFAPPGARYLLGATALEIFGVQATTQPLKPIAAVIGGFLGAALPRRRGARNDRGQGVPRRPAPARCEFRPVAE